jgi:uncharacterized membrane protein YoaK (UPF0700 family)
VFANAQTGNVVLLGIRAVAGDFAGAASYGVPVVAFVAGVFMAEVIRGRFKNGNIVHWRQIIIFLEAGLLAASAFVPTGSVAVKGGAAAAIFTFDDLVNVTVSFVCALQVQAFKKIRGRTTATTMCTGDLRSGAEALFQHDGGTGAHYFSIVALFAAGAALGAFAVHLAAEKASLFAVAGLVAVFAAMCSRPNGEF